MNAGRSPLSRLVRLAVLAVFVVFVFWFDSAAPPRRHGPVLRALQRARARDVAIAFMGGNHDYWVRAGRGPAG
jgi:hypothetical protein